MMKRRRRDETLRRRKGELSMAQAFELRVGCAAETRHFYDDDDRRAAWDEHRQRILSGVRPGHRPSAWWEFDRSAGERPRAHEHEVEALLRLGVATDADLNALAAEVHYFTDNPALCRYSAEDMRRLRNALTLAGVDTWAWPALYRTPEDGLQQPVEYRQMGA